MKGEKSSSWSTTGRVLLFVFLLLTFAAAWLGQRRWQDVQPRDVGGRQTAEAVVLVLAAMAWAGRRQTGVECVADTDREVPWSRGEALAVLGVFAVGVFFRVVHFSTVPAGMNHDAAWNGSYALSILKGAGYTPYISAAWGRETLFSYIATPFVYFWGNTPEAVQAAAALCGIAALLPVYLFVRAALGPRRALLALAFFAVSGWHGVFSRVGWRVIALPPFAALAAYAFWRSMNAGRVRDWLLLGASCALSLNTYNAGRIVPLMLAVLFAIFFVLRRRRWRKLVGGAAIALAAFLVVGVPMLRYAALNFEKWEGRAAHLVDERTQDASVAANVHNALAMFNYRGNGNDFFVEEPLLEPMAAIGFLLGLAVAVVRLWRPAYAFLLGGFALSLLPGIFSIPNGNRCVVAMPFVYALISLGICSFAASAASLVGLKQRRLVFTVLIVFPALVAAWESYAEFLGSHRRPIYGFSPQATAAGEFMHRYMSTRRVYVVSGNWPDYTLTYLSYVGESDPLEKHFVFTRSFDELQPEINRFGHRGLLFVLALDREGTEALGRLLRLFPEHRLEAVRARRWKGRVVARALFVEPAALHVEGQWSNASRTLLVRGKTGTSDGGGVTRCFARLGNTEGVSTRVRLMLPVRPVPGTAPVARLRWRRDCNGGEVSSALFTLVVDADGLVVVADHREVLVRRASLEAGRWYDVIASVDGGKRQLALSVGGKPFHPLSPLHVGEGPVRVAGLDVRSEGEGGQIYVDDITVLLGRVAPGGTRWRHAHDVAAHGFIEDCEHVPFGPLHAGGGWRDVSGAPIIAGGPETPAPSEESGRALAGRNAFDGGQGDGPGQFNEPMGVATDPLHRIYVSDRLNHRVQKFASDGRFLSMWGGVGDAPGQFREPHDCAADDQFLYVADTWNQRVQVFDWDGKFLFQIKDAPPLSSPRGIFARYGKIYLADSGNGVGRVFDRSGKLLFSFGEPGGSGAGHLVEPVDLVADSGGRIYVVNSGNNRIEIFSPTGEPVGRFPIPGWEGANLKESYLGIGDDDTLFLSDWDLGRVRRFRPNGHELQPLGPRVSRPSGLVVDSGRLLYTARGDAVLVGVALR